MPLAAGRKVRAVFIAGFRLLILGVNYLRPTWSGWNYLHLPAAERLPVLNETGIQTVINGPIPVSADGEPIMGLAPELR